MFGQMVIYAGFWTCSLCKPLHFLTVDCNNHRNFKCAMLENQFLPQGEKSLTLYLTTVLLVIVLFHLFLINMNYISQFWQFFLFIVVYLTIVT